MNTKEEKNTDEEQDEELTFGERVHQWIRAIFVIATIFEIIAMPWLYHKAFDVRPHSTSYGLALYGTVIVCAMIQGIYAASACDYE